jgi:peptidoglycan/LPS O-acetylase OafA/YrhL
MSVLLPAYVCELRKESAPAVSVSSLSLSSPYQLPRTIPQLDRLRGLAILLVLTGHISNVFPPTIFEISHQGWIGVDLFFVLSGFLITGILWDTRESKNYFGRFYGRRVLRIWPAYTLILILAFCIVPLLKLLVGGSPLTAPKEQLEVWPYLLMIQNYFAIALSTSAILYTTWSLAIEEQFYLVWPAVIRHASHRVILPLLFGGLLMAPFLRLWAMHRGFSPITIYYNPLTHGDGLLCGAVTAIWLRTARPTRRTLLLAGFALFLVGFVLFLQIHPTGAIKTVPHSSPLLYTYTALFSTGLLLVALVSENAGLILHRYFFMNRPLAFFGFISYSLYLYHPTILRIAFSEKLLAELDLWHHRHLTECLMVAGGIGISILIAWVSRVTLERFALSKKEIFG